MKQPSNKTSKIVNFIEALSTLTGEDLEEARDMLRAAGKDPDLLLKKSIEKLQVIREAVHARQEPDKLLFFDQPNQAITIGAAGDKDHEWLTADQVYQTLIQRRPLKGIPYNDLTIGTEIKALKFQQALRQLHFIVKMQTRDALIRPVLTRRQERQPIPLKNIDAVLSAGYVIIDNSFYALEKDWIPAARHFALNLSGDRMTLQQATGYFSKRDQLPFLTFEPEQLDLSQILQSPEFSDTSSLFAGQLYSYQQDGMKWLQYCCLNRLGGILGDDMGLGKTAQTIALIAWCIENNIFQHILIVVPGTLLENWRREFGVFAPSLVPYIHHGSRRTGAVSTLEEQKIVITSYSLVINDVYLLNKIRWGLLLLDEASLIRNPGSERRAALRQLPAEVSIAMTGTPLENSLTDLWSLTDFVRPGYLGTQKEFAARYIRKNIESTLADPGLAWLKTAVSYVMLRRKKEEVLNSLPEKTDIHQAVEMSETEAGAYEELRMKALEALAGNGKGQMVFQQIQDLRQFTTHPYLKNKTEIADASLTELKNASVKFSRTVELLDEIRLNQQKVLVFTEYLDMIDMMHKTFEEYYSIPVFRIDGRVETGRRQTTIDEFSGAAGFAIMILNPKVAGMGLNITAANHVIHYTRQWNPALEEQATARVYRNGQRKGVNVYYLFYSDTIEETIDNRLRAKSALSEEVIQTTLTEGTMEEYLEAISKSPIKK